MDPVTLIVAALALGAKEGLAGTAKTAIGDAYQGLKNLVRGKVGEDANVVDRFESKPDSWRAALEDVLAGRGLGADPEVTDRARELLDLAGPDVSTAAESYAITGNVTVIAKEGGVAALRMGDGTVIDLGGSRDPQAPGR